MRLRPKSTKKHTLSCENKIKVSTLTLDSSSIGLILSALGVLITQESASIQVQSSAYLLLKSLETYLEGVDPEFVKSVRKLHKTRRGFQHD